MFVIVLNASVLGDAGSPEIDETVSSKHLRFATDGHFLSYGLDDDRNGRRAPKR